MDYIVLLNLTNGSVSMSDMFQKIVVYFLSLGFSAAAATAIAVYAINTGGTAGAWDGPTPAGGVPEIDPHGIAPMITLLLGGTILIVTRFRKRNPRPAAI